MDITTVNDDGHYNVGESMLLEENDKLRKILHAGVLDSPELKVANIKWILGGIAMHQQCLKCNRKLLSRQHALDCTGYAYRLRQKFKFLNFTDIKRNELDVVHNYYRNEKNVELYLLTEKIVTKIYKRCLGFRKKNNGFWTQGIG
jgi:hypothetical protein